MAAKFIAAILLASGLAGCAATTGQSRNTLETHLFADAGVSQDAVRRAVVEQTVVLYRGGRDPRTGLAILQEGRTSSVR